MWKVRVVHGNPLLPIDSRTAEQIFKFLVSVASYGYPECLWPIGGYPRSLGSLPHPVFFFLPNNSAIWPNEHVTLFEGNAWTDFNALSGERYDCPAALLCYLGNLCQDHMGAAHSPFYYFEKRCRHLLVGKWSLTLSFLTFRTLLAWLSPATNCFFATEQLLNLYNKNQRTNGVVRVFWGIGWTDFQDFGVREKLWIKLRSTCFSFLS